VQHTNFENIRNLDLVKIIIEDIRIRIRRERERERETESMIQMTL